MLTTEIDIDTLVSQRDQLFAEALVRYRRGELVADPGFEAEHMEPEQEQRFEGDPWDEPIAIFLAGRTRTTIFEVAQDALKFDTHEIGTTDQRRISAILEESAGAAASARPRNAGGSGYDACRTSDDIPRKPATT